MTENNDKENLHKIYLEERRELIKSQIEGSKQFDRAILTYSSGALMLSIIFMEKIASSPIQCKCLLILSWIFFILAIISTIISFLLSQKAHEEQIEILEELYIQGREEPRPNKFSSLTKYSNILSAIFFILAALFLVIFSYKNIK